MTHTTHMQTDENKALKKKFNWGLLLVGILFVAGGILSFANPAGSIGTIAYAFAFLAIVYGIWLIASSMGSGWRVVGGILDILLGIFLITNIYVAIVAIPYIFAAWFIADSLVRLFTIGATRLLGTGYFVFSLILNILGLVVGVMLLFDPITSALTLSFLVGFYLLLAGVECIIFSLPRSNSL